MNEEKIRCEGLVKTYNKGRKNEFKALKGIDLIVKRGEFVSITGHSGSGKSTFLNQISCLDTLTYGKIYIEGVDISKLDELGKAKLRRQKLGFIFQQFNLIRSMSALENVELPMEFNGMPKGKRLKRAKELLNLVGISDKAKNLPTELSGGEQQRVAIARALANNPDIILADEPTGNLDTSTGDMIMDLLRKLNKGEGKTLILVTHELEIAKKADKTIMLRDGVIVSDTKNGKG